MWVVVTVTLACLAAIVGLSAATETRIAIPVVGFLFGSALFWLSLGPGSIVGNHPENLLRPLFGHEDEDALRRSGALKYGLYAVIFLFPIGRSVVTRGIGANDIFPIAAEAGLLVALLTFLALPLSTWDRRR